MNTIEQQKPVVLIIDAAPNLHNMYTRGLRRVAEVLFADSAWQARSLIEQRQDIHAIVMDAYGTMTPAEASEFIREQRWNQFAGPAVVVSRETGFRDPLSKTSTCFRTSVIETVQRVMNMTLPAGQAQQYASPSPEHG